MKYLIFLIITFITSPMAVNSPGYEKDTDKRFLGKLLPGSRYSNMNSCLDKQVSTNYGNCSIDDMFCSQCDESGSNICCQVVYEACYYWIAGC